jgi:hypothetical protein
MCRDNRPAPGCPVKIGALIDDPHGYIVSNWITKMDTYYPLYCFMAGKTGIYRNDYLTIINSFQLVTSFIDLLAQQMQNIKLNGTN